MTAEEILGAARAAGIRIAVAESCTGGLLAAALTAVPGSSDVFERGAVTYSNAAKSEMLGVDPVLIEAHGAVSEEVARAMAEGLLARSGAALTVCVTGIAGPGGSEHKPEGRVCFGLAHAGVSQAHTVEFGSLGRGAVRSASVQHALDMLGAALKQMR